MAGSGETVTYAQLNDRSNQLAQLFWDAGLRFGDHIAVLMENRVEFFELCWAAQRSGLYYTCINWHFNADETAYILDDCDAQVLVISDTFRDVAAELVDKMPNVKLRLMVGDTVVDGYEPYADARNRYPAEPLEEELEGTRMLYSSGTTGRPKGVKYKITRQRVGEQPVEMGMMTAVWGMDGDAIYLSPAPLYHSAPLFYSMSTMRLGGTVIAMEHFDPEQALALIEKYHVTHAQFVPTMFVRMLKLPEDVRQVRPLVAEGRAPRGRAVLGRDQAQDDRLVGPDHRRVLRRDRRHRRHLHQLARLARPPGLGRPLDARPDPHPRRREQRGPRRRGRHRLVRAAAQPARLRVPQGREKTRDSFNDRGWSTVGDMGYLDADGYLFLTDRRTFMIVSGGVNIYPQEAENLLIDHPKVYDVAVFGIPDPEMGERVHAVVQPTDWDEAGPELERELLAYCREHLAKYKCPQAVDFDRELPASKRASSTSDCCATATGATRRAASFDGEARSFEVRPMKILASGRDGDIFEFAPGLVLRKTRDGRSIAHEARTMRYVAEHGYPVPRIEEVRADGTEIIMERIDGPIMMDAMVRPPWKLGDHLRLLADLHDQLHRIPAPDWLPAMPTTAATHPATLLHLDLHPLNVIMSPNGPVVIDWPNARRGDPMVDVALVTRCVIAATSRCPARWPRR